MRPGHNQMSAKCQPDEHQTPATNKNIKNIKNVKNEKEGEKEKSRKKKKKDVDKKGKEVVR